MVGLPNEAFRFLLFIFIGMIISFVAEGLGLAIGATFSITVKFIFIQLFTIYSFLLTYI